MLTIFTSPKKFQGHISVIQNNAIKSWAMLQPKCDIIIFGGEEGTAEAAKKHGAKHIPQVECNEYGTPLISAMFKTAQEMSRYPLVCYLNSDIILTGDFLPVIERVSLDSFLMVGQRTDMDIKEPLAYDNPEWEKDLRESLHKSGRLHPPSGIDYFVFPKGQYPDIPPLAVGRAGWDNWLLYHTQSRKIPIVDATGVITAVHQNHDYSHYPGGITGVWQGAEAKQNRDLMGGYKRTLNIYDATLQLKKSGLRRTPLSRRLSQGVLRWRGAIGRLIRKPKSIW